MKSGFIKGALMGAAVAGILTMMYDPITPKMRKKAKRKITYAMSGLGDCMDTMMGK